MIQNGSLNQLTGGDDTFIIGFALFAAANGRSRNYIPNFPALRRNGRRGKRRSEIGRKKKRMNTPIIESGGKQYKAVEGSMIESRSFTRRSREAVELDQVLLLVDGEEVKVGTPTVAGVRVSSKVAAQFKGPKVVIFKYRPKKRYRVKTGTASNIHVTNRFNFNGVASMAHKKGGGSSRNGRDSNSQRLGVKKICRRTCLIGKHPGTPTWHAYQAPV